MLHKDVGARPRFYSILLLECTDFVITLWVILTVSMVLSFFLFIEIMNKEFTKHSEEVYYHTLRLAISVKNESNYDDTSGMTLVCLVCDVIHQRL